MRYFLDTEFSERGHEHPVELISIGMVAEDGREFYAVASDGWSESRCNDWVKANVLPQLADPRTGGAPRFTRAEITKRALNFIGDFGNIGEKPEFWGYYCVVPETRVLTSDLLWVPIGSLHVGNKLLAFEENTSRGTSRSSKWRQWRSAIVEHTNVIRRPCVDLTFDDGTRVRCTEDHRWLTSNQESARWVTTQKLTPGKSKVAKPLDIWETGGSYNDGYLAAAFDGEGFLSQRLGSKSNERCISIFRIGFAQKDNPMLAKVRLILTERNFTVARKQLTRKDGVYNLLVANRHEVLRFLGMLRPPRLLAKFSPDRVGAMIMRSVRLVSKKACGTHNVVSLTTSTGTYLAEGLASHNCDYDWVVFCQLFGTMMDLPKGWPMYCNDVKQLCVALGDPRLPKHTACEHNALVDARHVRAMYKFLEFTAAQRYLPLR